jgi:hypothetical protein
MGQLSADLLQTVIQSADHEEHWLHCKSNVPIADVTAYTLGLVAVELAYALALARCVRWWYALGMKIHLFQSLREPDVFGFTGDETGANLPAELGPWAVSGSGGPLETGPGDRLIRHGQCGPIFVAIQRDGFYVARSETLSRDTGVPWIGT